MTLTSASFFSGVAGMDRGLDAAGFTTVSFSEIEPYANAILASRYPDVPNLGSITDWRDWPDGPWQTADLWAGGPPCQDLSVAGKRAGLAGARSGLALTWFDAVATYRPRAILLENVPGLLSSNKGDDLRALIDRLEDLGYVGSFRTLNARHFGVPQRRRRVFLVAVRAGGGSGAERARAVLAVPHRCERHPRPFSTEGEDTPARFADGVGGAGPLGQAISSKWAKQSSGPAGDEHHHLLIVPFVKRHRAMSDDDYESWGEGTEAPTINGFDVGDSRATVAVLTSPTLNSNKGGGWRYDADQAESLVMEGPRGVRRLTPLECERLMGWPDGWTIPATWRKKSYDGSDLLPAGLDSNRYRVIGNGVASPVAEWIGRRLAPVLEEPEWMF